MAKLNTLLVLLVGLSIFIACQPSEPAPYGNPAAPNFNMEGSDEKAIAIADEVMEACGGRENWDNTRYLSWVFANRRKHHWDKLTGAVRIESLPDSTTYVMNVNTMEGKIYSKSRMIADPDSVKALLQKGKSIWINDSYWLVMPFKMKDDGVTLKYLGEKNTEEGQLANVVEMTFKAVGDTPNNKYHVLVDKEKKLVLQWSYYRNATQDTVNFTMPWRNYQKYGNLLLSDDRERLMLKEIEVLDHLPDSLFTAY